MKIPTFKKILFATDFSQFATDAFPFAVRFTQIYGAKLHLLHVISPKEEDNNKAMDKKVVQEITESVYKDFKELTKKSDLTTDQFIVRTLVAPSAEQGIVDYISKNSNTYSHYKMEY